MFDGKHKVADFYYRALFSLSDIAIILAFAYIGNFGFLGKCNLSTYHYYVTLDIILLVCSIVVVTFTTSRHRYFRTLAGVIRLVLTLLLLFSLGFFFGYQLLKNRKTRFPKWKSGTPAILLPASCFMDPDLIRNGPFSSSRKKPLSDVELDHIGHPVKNSGIPGIWLYALS